VYDDATVKERLSRIAIDAERALGLPQVRSRS
jgi:hypothetical protein